MAHTDLAPAPHDGSQGNILQRAEPKVRVAGLIALLTPVVLYYIDTYVPGLKELGQPLNAVIDTLLTGVLTFAGAYLTPAVDRVDLFVEQTKAELEKVSIRAIGETATHRAEDELSHWVHDLKPAGEALVAAAESVSVAAAEHTDPIVAARNAEPAVRAAFTDAGLRIAADTAATASTLVPTVEAAVVSALTPAVGAPLADSLVGGAAQAVSSAVDKIAADPGVGVTQLIDALHKALAALEPAAPAEASPIGDAARAAVPTAVDSRPPVPDPVPATAPMAAVLADGPSGV